MAKDSYRNEKAMKQTGNKDEVHLLLPLSHLAYRITT